MPLEILTEIDSQLSLASTARKLLSIAMALLVAVCLLGTSGCIALSIPSKRFHDPQDRGGLLGDFRHSGADNLPVHPVHAGHLLGDPEHSTQCTENGCAGLCGSGMSSHDFDEDAEFRVGGHHPKAPDVPWPRYHPVPTRPVFSGYPGLHR